MNVTCAPSIRTVAQYTPPTKTATRPDVIWDVDLKSAYAASPVIFEGVAYVLYGLGEGIGAFRGLILGLDVEDGTVLWRREMDTVRPLPPPVLDDTHVAVVSGTRVRIFDRRTGEETYWYPFSKFAWGTAIALADGVIYALSPQRLVAIDVDSERPWHDVVLGAWLRLYTYRMAPRPPASPKLWSAPEPPAGAFSPVVLPDLIVVAGSGGEVRGYDRSSGDVVWSAEIGSIVSPPVATADGLLMVLDNALALVDPGDGQTLWRREFDIGSLQAALITSHGTYVVTRDGTLLALR